MLQNDMEVDTNVDTSLSKSIEQIIPNHKQSITIG